MGTELYSKVEGWLAEPFQPSMSAWEIVALVGLVMIASFFWSRIIVHLTA